MVHNSAVQQFTTVTNMDSHFWSTSLQSYGNEVGAAASSWHQLYTSPWLCLRLWSSLVFAQMTGSQVYSSFEFGWPTALPVVVTSTCWRNSKIKQSLACWVTGPQRCTEHSWDNVPRNMLHANTSITPSELPTWLWQTSAGESKTCPQNLNFY